jgi:hypothetical protein
MVKVVDRTKDEVAAMERREKVAGLAGKFFDGCDVEADNVLGWINIELRGHGEVIHVAVVYDGDWMMLRDARYLGAAKSFGAAYEKEIMHQEVVAPQWWLRRLFNRTISRQFGIRTDYSRKA